MVCVQAYRSDSDPGVDFAGGAFARLVGASIPRSFERRRALYREVVANVGAHAGRYRRLSELVAFIESQTASALSLRRVKIALHESEDVDSRKRFLMASRRIETLLSRARAAGVSALRDDVFFGEQKYNVAYVLRREDRDADSF